MRTSFSVSTYVAPEKPKMKVLVVGKSGSGKTHLMGTYPSLLLVKTEEGLATLRHLTGKLQIIELSQKMDVYQEMLGLMSLLKNGTMDPMPETLAIDSLVGLSYFMERNIAGEHKESMEWGQYSIHKNRMITLLGRLCELPMNVIVSAVPGIVSDEASNTSEEHPNVAGNKEPPLIAPWFDEVYYLECEKSKRDEKEKYGEYVYVAYTKPRGLFKQAKTRYGLPIRIVDPSYNLFQSFWRSPHAKG